MPSRWAAVAVSILPNFFNTTDYFFGKIPTCMRFGKVYFRFMGLQYGQASSIYLWIFVYCDYCGHPPNRYQSCSCPPVKSHMEDMSHGDRLFLSSVLPNRMLLSGSSSQSHPSRSRSVVQTTPCADEAMLDMVQNGKEHYDFSDVDDQPATALAKPRILTWNLILLDQNKHWIWMTSQQQTGQQPRIRTWNPRPIDHSKHLQSQLLQPSWR